MVQISRIDRQTRGILGSGKVTQTQQAGPTSPQENGPGDPMSLKLTDVPLLL